MKRILSNGQIDFVVSRKPWVWDFSSGPFKVREDGSTQLRVGGIMTTTNSRGIRDIRDINIQPQTSAIKAKREEWERKWANNDWS